MNSQFVLAFSKCTRRKTYWLCIYYPRTNSSFKLFMNFFYKNEFRSMRKWKFPCQIRKSSGPFKLKRSAISCLYFHCSQYRVLKLDCLSRENIVDCSRVLWKLLHAKCCDCERVTLYAAVGEVHSSNLECFLYLNSLRVVQIFTLLKRLSLILYVTAVQLRSWSAKSINS